MLLSMVIPAMLVWAWQSLQSTMGTWGVGLERVTHLYLEEKGRAGGLLCLPCLAPSWEERDEV